MIVMRVVVMVVMVVMVIKVRTRHLQTLSFTVSVCDDLLDLCVVHSLSRSGEAFCLVGLMGKFTLKVVLHEEPTLSASEESRAWTDHVGSESKLLAVKDEGVSVIVHLVLHVGALLVEHVALGHVESEVFHDGVELLLAGRNCGLKEAALSNKPFAHVIDFLAQVYNRLFQRLKCNH